MKELKAKAMLMAQIKKKKLMRKRKIIHPESASLIIFMIKSALY